MDVFLEKKRTLLIIFLYVIVIVYSTRIKKWTGWEIYGKTINAAFFEVWRREIDKRKLNSKLRRMENKKKQDKDAAADYPL